MLCIGEPFSCVVAGGYRKSFHSINEAAKLETGCLDFGTKMDLNALADFNLVATHGGFGKASRASGRSKATLSRRISDLEEALGVRLIERGTHRLELTEAGELLRARTEEPMHEFVDAAAAVREGLSVPRGRLRVAAPLLFSQLALGRLSAQFVALYPEVRMEVVAEDRVVDLIDERFDVAIRPNPRQDTTLVGRCFAKDRLVVAAAPSVPIPIIESDAPIPIPAVVMRSLHDGELWSVDGGRFKIEPRPVLHLSSLLMVRDAVIAGGGVALLPESIIWNQLAAGQLVQWGTAGKDVELWVLHTSRRLPSPKVRAFVEFMCAQYPTGSLVLPG
jgi:DNA-binding transcriptional LysR family regulator